MGSDQIAEIAPGVREMLAGGPDWCTTFEIPSDSDRWVQFTVGIINAAYPHNEAPESRLGELGSFTLEEWEPNKYVSGRLALEDARSIACWIDRYFVAILGCDWDYSLDVLYQRAVANPLKDSCTSAISRRPDIGPRRSHHRF